MDDMYLIKNNPGYIYLMRNDSLKDNIYKCGFTKKTPEKRRISLSNSSIPFEYEIIHASHVIDCQLAERFLFNLINDFRHAENREFFECYDAEIIVSYINYVSYTINSCNVGEILEKPVDFDDF